MKVQGFDQLVSFSDLLTLYTVFLFFYFWVVVAVVVLIVTAVSYTHLTLPTRRTV